jgi:hypothetical protein
LITGNIVPNSGWRVKERLKRDGIVRIAVAAVFSRVLAKRCTGQNDYEIFPARVRV